MNFQMMKRKSLYRNYLISSERKWLYLIKFKDLNGLDVELSFKNDQFITEIGHVLIVLQHDGKWLLTKHPKRGIEFPGGKKEIGETIGEAAIRETIEETGVTISDIKQIAAYVVYDDPPFCKAVFTGAVQSIDDNYERYETEGAVWLTDEELSQCENLSFYMRDEGMAKIREWMIDD